MNFALQGIGVNELAAYDYSPFGDANVNGRDIIVTLGIVWNCPSVIGARGRNITGPCFREFNLSAPPEAALAGVLLGAGIFPAEIKVDGTTTKWNYPVSRLLGELELDAGRQMWGRGLSHLLGHSLGIPFNEVVRNAVAPAGRHQKDENSPLVPLKPESYRSWDGLSLAPTGIGTPTAEDPPNYTLLARTDQANSDPDNDTVLEHDDNCPGVYNKDQDNSDFGPWWQQALGARRVNIAEFGDACDPDIDGDGIPQLGRGERAASRALSPALLTGAPDHYPFDTDNDALDNVVDVDDDNDTIPDLGDNCRLHANTNQTDLDGDGFGTPCDIDDDGDTVADQIEVLFGSKLDVALSTPEYTGWQSSCSNGLDDDRDGVIDAQDSGCVDGDGDQVADSQDNCPGLANPTQYDADDDGVGEACQLRVDIAAAQPELVLDDTATVEIAWSATRSGNYTVRVGATGCGDGVVVESGPYNRGTDGAAITAFTTIAASRLVSGNNRVMVCISTGATTAGSPVFIAKGLPAALAPSIELDRSYDAGISDSDRLTNETDFALVGTAQPGATVIVRRNGVIVDSVIASITGEWRAFDTEVPAGTHSYDATAILLGASSVPSAPLSITIDITPPETTILTGPSEGAITGSSVGFTLGGVDAVRFECRVDAAAFAPCGSTVSLSDLVPGAHRFVAVASDAAGNRDASESIRNFTVQTISNFRGFLPPLGSPPAIGKARAGQSVPVKFSLSGYRGPNVFLPRTPTSRPVDCVTKQPLGPSVPTETPGASGLSYDPATDVYSYIWKTERNWVGCRELRVALNDGSVHVAYLEFR